MRLLVLSVLLFATTVIGSAHGQGKKTTFADIPEPVLSGAKRDLPDVKWSDAFTFRDTKTWYRLVGKTSDQRTVVYNAFADGSLMDVGTVLKWDDLPAPVRTALKRKDAGFEPSLVVTIGKKVGAVTGYRVNGKSTGGKDRIYVVAADSLKITEQAAPPPMTTKKKR